MSYVASHVATVPSGAFKWFLIFLEGPFADEIRKEIDAHFLTLGREAGKDALVVRGFDPTSFRDSVYEAPAFFDDKWRKRGRFPALLVTNCQPSEALSDARNLDSGKVMIFPLEGIYREKQSIAGFLTELLEALRHPDASTALQELDGTKLQKCWGWLTKYSKMEPEFFGFSLKLNEAVRDLLAR